MTSGSPRLYWKNGRKRVVAVWSKMRQTADSQVSIHITTASCQCSMDLGIVTSVCCSISVLQFSVYTHYYVPNAFVGVGHITD